MTPPLAHMAGSAEFYWAIVSELSLLVWTGLLLSAPLLGRPTPRPWRFRLVGLFCAGVAAVITLVGKLAEVYPGHPLFPSGHTAWAATIAILVVARDRRWLIAVVPLLALLEVALVLADYHEPIDLLGGLVVAAGVGGAGAGWLARRGGYATEAGTGAARRSPSTR